MLASKLSRAGAANNSYPALVIKLNYNLLAYAAV